MLPAQRMPLRSISIISWSIRQSGVRLWALPTPFDFSDWATVTPRVDWSYHDDEYNDALNDPRLYQDSYHLLNASIVMETNDGRWESMLGSRTSRTKST